MDSTENKLLKVLVHASAFFAPFLIPIVVYFVSSDKEIKSLSLQAMLFQVFLLVAAAISAILMFVIVGFILAPIVAIIGVVIPIIGIVKALQGDHWEYPVIGKLL